ncbi:MAG: alkane 1-monooxygenase [Sphingobacteriales bacterium]|nr:MAG: alkane 1-monooxygenase [Sphingobacteriales bacterium]
MHEIVLWSAVVTFKTLKYALPLLTYLAVCRSFTQTGLECWIPVLYAFVLTPLAELLMKPSPANLNEAEEELARKNRLYDAFLYAAVPLQYGALIFFLANINSPGLSGWDIAGRVLSMGFLCGSYGINIGHELGHRVNKKERFLAKALLLTSLYMHFFIEHNRGHHRHVGTPADPSTAPKGQSVYAFWLRSISGVYLKAWSIAADEQRKKGQAITQNEMLHYQIIQLMFLVLTGFLAGWFALTMFIIAALMGIVLLETVNYIEHYGLKRRQRPDGSFERAMPEHSWDSHHIIGRTILFELSRHSDHHYQASRKYQLLRHHEEAPQLPAGYPGSMLLAMIPPVWFRVMHKRMDAYTRSGVIHQE